MAKTKAEVLAEQIAETVGAGKELHLESVDFSDPNRPKTCLEVDFPILPINQIAQIEGNAGKPIYQMSKWWARRRSSVFRSTLIAAATKAPGDPAEAAKLVWDSYYGNHQKNEAFRKLKVADIFMGGGTTLVEGARLGMQMAGNDLNPVAWLVVKNELADVDLDEVNKLFDHVEREVKPQIMPFYACEGPNGEKGVWTHVSSGKKMGDDFDPLELTPDERKQYSYEGPSVVYTFWAKHGPCAASGCGHRTPLMTSPVVAVKKLTVKAWLGIPCSHCHKTFDLERHEARMAPHAPLVVAETEHPYAIMDDAGYYSCPYCGEQQRDEIAAVKGESSRLLKKSRKNKKVDLTLLVHPDWMKGAQGHDGFGPLGGTADSDVESTCRWNELRASTLGLIEVRGALPQIVTCPVTGVKLRTDEGNIPSKSKFTCMEDTCGLQQDALSAMKKFGGYGPTSSYALQCFSETYSLSGSPYGGRYFKALSGDDVDRQNAALREWERRKNTDLAGYWPDSEIPTGYETHYKRPLPQHGYSKYWHMFNSAQLLIHSIFLKEIDRAYGFSRDCKDIVIGAFQQYLRNQNMFCFWNMNADKMEPMFSNNNFHPKTTFIQNSVFSKLGRGNWQSSRANTIKGIEWCQSPWETISNEYIKSKDHDLAKLVTGKSEKTYAGDPVLAGNALTCKSSTELDDYQDETFDLIVTDPPFGGILQYAEFSDFFYVWLRPLLSQSYPEVFSGGYSPKALEVVANDIRHDKDGDGFYKRLLTECWKESNRLLKTSGILSFTFHHSEDEPWVDVLESLFEAGFYLEATYPIRSDETKGEKSQFGSQKIEYDIIHVCRKRIEEPKRISWARLRRQILADVRQLQGILEHHQNEGLPKADIQVVKRGKALEYFSRHYGQVYVEEGREFTVKEALVGINQLLDDQAENEGGSTPVKCEPISRQFLRIFHKTLEVPRDQMQKYLRGTGIGPSDFVSRGWTEEKKKIFHWVSPLTFAQEHSAKFHTLHRDLDQAMVLVGACFADSGINVKKLLSGDFKPHPALGDLLNWWVANGGNEEMRNAATTARQLYNTWAANNQQTVQEQYALFDME